jgi:homeobox protein cut-like
VDNQKESVLGRKALADKTKGFRPVALLSLPQTAQCRPSEFKKISEAEKPNAFKGLLKGTLNHLWNYKTSTINAFVQRTKRKLITLLNVPRRPKMLS